MCFYPKETKVMAELNVQAVRKNSKGRAIKYKALSAGMCETSVFVFRFPVSGRF